MALLKGGCTEMMILRSAMQFDSDLSKWNLNTRVIFFFLIQLFCQFIYICFCVIIFVSATKGGQQQRVNVVDHGGRFEAGQRQRLRSARIVYTHIRSEVATGRKYHSNTERNRSVHSQPTENHTHRCVEIGAGKICFV